MDRNLIAGTAHKLYRQENSCLPAGSKDREQCGANHGRKACRGELSVSKNRGSHREYAD